MSGPKVSGHPAYQVFAWSSIVEVDHVFGQEPSRVLMEDLLCRFRDKKSTIENLDSFIELMTLLGSAFIGDPRVLLFIEQFANTHCCPLCQATEYTMSRKMLAEALYFGHYYDTRFVHGATCLLEEVFTHLTRDTETVSDKLFLVQSAQSCIRLGLDHPYFAENRSTAIYRTRWSRARRAWIQAVTRAKA